MTIILNPQSLAALKSLKGLAKFTRRGITSAMFEIGKDLRSTSRKKMQEPKHGHESIIRVRGRLPRRHIASAPGEAPAIRTGNLNVSVATEIHGGFDLKFGAGNNEKVIYARYLELGNKTRNLKPRPFLKPSIDENDKNIRERVLRGIKKYVEKGAK